MARRQLLIAVLVLWVTGPYADAQRPFGKLAVAPSEVEGRSANITISVVATTDLHGGVLPRGERGGLALLGGYVRNLRAARVRDGGGTLLVDSGDMFQGTLESNLNEGAAVVRAYNALGYAAAAIGNHEFDFGPAGPDETPRTPGEDPRGALKARAAEARFPFLAANTVEGATVVIVLAHAGGRCTRLDDPEDLGSCDQMAEIVNVARQLPAGLVDMISAGHTHQAMAQDVAGIAVVEAYSGGRSFSRVDLSVNRSSGALVSKKIFPPRDVTAGPYENRAVTPDAATAAAIAPAARRALTIKNQPLR